MLGGEAIGFEEIRFDDFRIPAGVNGWLEFVNHTTLPMLRRMRLYLHDRKQQEIYKAASRKRLEQLSRNET